jgi:hypothetical protein
MAADRQLPPLPPRPTRELPPRAARESAAPKQPVRETRAARPDARPMRLVYGAGAVAALSVMAVGLVQPDPGATDPAAAPDPTAKPDRVAQAPADSGVRHVTRYIHLKPGQTAPPGAKVIAADAPTPRIVVTHNGPSAPVSQPATQPAPKPAPTRKPVTRQSGRPRP